MAHLQAHAVKQITEICERYKNERTPLMMILSDIQKEFGYIPLEVQELVSEKIIEKAPDKIKERNIVILTDNYIKNLDLFFKKCYNNIAKPT